MPKGWPLPAVAALAVAVSAVLAAPAAARPAEALTALVDAAAQRLQTAPAVAAFKWRTGGAIEDPVRAGQVLDAVAADAVARGADPVFVRQVFVDQIDATEGIEYALFAEWSFDPAAAPPNPPDLASSRAIIDRLNRAMVEQLVVQRGVLLSPQCPQQVGNAVDQVTAARGLDALHRRALGAATRSYCR